MANYIFIDDSAIINMDEVVCVRKAVDSKEPALLVTFKDGNTTWISVKDDVEFLLKQIFWKIK